MSWNLPLFIISPIDRGIISYEHGGGRRCISIDGDHGRSIIGSSGSELGPSDRGSPRSEKDLGEVEVLEWWKAAPNRG